MRKVLVVDDQQHILNVLQEEIGKVFAEVEILLELDFGRAATRIESDRPDVVVLDLLQGAIAQDPPGQATWKAIWSMRFCPVVIYTGFDGTLVPPVPDHHPFVKVVRKGVGTTEHVVSHLRAFQPIVTSIRAVHAEVDRVLQQVLRDTAGSAAITDARPEYLVHAARRRVAALMDEESATEGRALFSWEQYLLPALGESLLTGDILRRRGEVWNNADAYRIVLSPSCDLVKDRSENTVLVARCSSSAAMKSHLSLPGKLEKAADRIQAQVLSQGHWNGYLPLPNFPHRIPLLVANLKDLEVLNYSNGESTGQDSGRYDRIASIDSPFREQVSWAFLTTIARPGMPERDLTPWARDLAGEPSGADAASGSS